MRIQNNIQRYHCPSCNKTFSLQNKINSIDIWTEYSEEKQTYKQLADKYQCSRHILKALKATLNIPKIKRLIYLLAQPFGEENLMCLF